MAYRIRSLETRREIENAWNTRSSIEEICNIIDRGYQTVYRELRLGYDGTYLPNGKKKYSASLAYKRDVENHESLLITLDQRRKFEELYNSGMSYEELSKKTVFASRTAVCNEIKLGTDGLYYPDGRKHYDAATAQERYMERVFKRIRRE